MPSAVIPDSVDVIDAGSFAQRGVIGGEGEAGVVDADVENFAIMLARREDCAILAWPANPKPCIYGAVEICGCLGEIPRCE